MIDSNSQPSFYYFLVAQALFQRSRRSADLAKADALCEIGKVYLAKARPRSTPSEDAAAGSGRRPT